MNVTFEQWHEANPLAWYPGCGRTEQEHLHMAMTARSLIGAFGDMPEVEGLVAALDAQIPKGFQGPFPEDVAASTLSLCVSRDYTALVQSAAKLADTIHAGTTAGVFDARYGQRVLDSASAAVKVHAAAR